MMMVLLLALVMTPSNAEQIIVAAGQEAQPALLRAVPVEESNPQDQRRQLWDFWSLLTLGEIGRMRKLAVIVLGKEAPPNAPPS